MKLFLLYEKSFKNGFYLDYYFKNVIIYFYKNILGNNYIYLIDKYIAEKFFFIFKNFLTYISTQFTAIKSLSFIQITKLIIIILIQLLLIFFL